MNAQYLLEVSRLLHLLLLINKRFYYCFYLEGFKQDIHHMHDTLSQTFYRPLI